MTLADLVPSLRPTLAARLEPGLWPLTAAATCDGRLTVGGADLVELAGRFATPLVVLDTADVRARCRAYRDALPEAEIAYAAKAFLCRAMARTVAQEGCSIDACSGGEITTTAAAGVPGERILLHGNVKTDEDLKAALDARVGRIVIDSLDEIDRLAALVPHRQQVLLRVTPDVDAGTHPGRTTGTHTSKFGLPIATGDAAAAIRRVLGRPELELVGLHCHIGSQVTSIARYESAAVRVIALLAAVSREHGLALPQLNLGGGHAVGYTDGAPSMDPAAFGRAIRGTLARSARAHGIPVPALTIEPGRAIVARAGVTVYRVGAVKRTAGRTFVAVDGGMSDNPRPALYGARYPLRLLGRATKAPTEQVSVVGRHCESTDTIADDVALPCDIVAGDMLALPCSGAYHASMASTYNQVGRAAVVAVGGGAAMTILRRDTPEDLLRRDVVCGQQVAPGPVGAEAHHDAPASVVPRPSNVKRR
ncbi:MAG: diaminopimelate decarboxylase [Pseudonocardia sp.]|nr:diaminopimelate decarboxylase [Pseudonocardia sp.]